MKKFRTAIFMIAGIIGLVLQTLGLYIVLILLGIITKTWIVLTIVGILLTIVDIWKRKYYVSQGYKGNLLGYTKPENIEK